MRLISLALVLVIGLALGCAYGAGTTRTVDESPTLAITGAPEGATLHVDGIDFGLATRFSGASPVEVIPGVHIIEIRQAGEVLYREKVYSGTGSTTTVAVPDGQL
jgi:hypothetical protein